MFTVITNEPENTIIAATINGDGTLNIDRAVATGGRSLHGGGIEASAKGKVLATVNPGSNTISLFSIDPNMPTNISPLGDPVSSEGEFPMSLIFNTAGDLCVLNGVVISNTLRHLPLNQTTPPNGPPGTASQIVFNHDESHLIVSDVTADGSLSADFKQVTPPSGGGLPFSLTPIPGKNAFVSTDPALGFSVLDLSGQNKSSAFAINGQGATCWSSFSAKTGNFYLTDVGTSTVTEVHVDDNLKASIFLYIMSANATSVDVLALPGAGKARKISTLDISGPARAAGVPIDRNSLQGMTHFIRQ
ncbi:hypothetical protein L226DRAFT_552064 [Lentinus tigrinus ALCF2SS1-7]|uniref:Isomerase YbhE n=1 Tax=Lentinus tigrinus ALCF2SS1-6 TaxID=1328759 RepID=A0A5C2SK28_9APHY|nr:hypothetical protein L227DRAFT_591357 [Lentinus tigrinus ALCF2SS1-6]RPD76292.1 hypothetical protein L226DRAFT_552064 [Lentinus tigrinus ALCF2SS1-7]